MAFWEVISCNFLIKGNYPSFLEYISLFCCCCFFTNSEVGAYRCSQCWNEYAEFGTEWRLGKAGVMPLGKLSVGSHPDRWDHYSVGGSTWILYLLDLFCIYSPFIHMDLCVLLSKSFPQVYFHFWMIFFSFLLHWIIFQRLFWAEHILPHWAFKNWQSKSFE